MKELINPFVNLKVMTIVASATILSGCETLEQNAALECGAGASVGSYFLCKASGKSAKECNKIALAGGLVGGAVCYGYASKLNKHKKVLEGKEDDLDARLQYVKNVNEESRKLNEKLEMQVATLSQEIDKEIFKQEQQKTESAELDNLRNKLKNNIEKANEQLDASKAALEDMRQFKVRQTKRSEELDAQIVTQQKLYNDTQKLIANLTQQSQRIG